jgi:Protein of unknown function (DUF1360)
MTADPDLTAEQTRVRDVARGPFEDYADEPRPLGPYGLLAGIFAVAVGGSLVALRMTGKHLPKRIRAGDVLLGGVATHKLSRLLAKDKVTSFLRAPFTEYQGPGGPGEVEEKPRGSGLRYATGELLVCPYCLGLWVATAYGLGHVAAPRATRLAGFVLTALTISDSLQIAYKAAEEKGL